MKVGESKRRDRVWPAALAPGLVAFALMACEAQPPAASHATEEGAAEPVHLKVDLERGSRGDDVRALQGYLTRYGYFPNAELLRRYPGWRPAVKQAPTAGLYDEHTEAAVRALQRNSGFVETGRADSLVREVLAQHRCGVPDNIAPLDPRDKFALITGQPWWDGRTSLSWRFQSGFLDPIAAADVRAQLAAAFATWANVIDMTFAETTGPADIEISFAFLGAVAVSTAPPAGDIQFNINQTWSVATPTPDNALDFQSVALHEIGHTLGLAHSSRGSIVNLVMWPGISGGSHRRNLHADDILGVSLKGTAWEQVSGCAKDIAVYDHNNVWVLDCGLSGGSGFVQKWNGSNWTADTGMRIGVNIAVDANGRPWVQTGNGTLMRKSSSSPTSGTWSEVGGCWHDIGISRFSNEAWATACHPSGDAIISKYNSALGFFEPDAAGGMGRRISVDSMGFPWVVQTNGSIYRKTTHDVASGSWTLLPGGAFDIGVAGNDAANSLAAWVIGGSQTIWQFNFQVATGDGSEGGAGAPSRPASWIQKDGAAVRISVGPGGPWVINSAGLIFREKKFAK